MKRLISAVLVGLVVGYLTHVAMSTWADKTKAIENAQQVMAPVGSIEPRPAPESNVDIVQDEPTVAKQSCEQLRMGIKIVEDTNDTLRNQYEEAYFDTEEYKAFMAGYWDGFWRQHKYCKICIANDDVPADYRN